METLHQALTADCVHRLRERAVAERRSWRLTTFWRSERRAQALLRRAERSARQAELRARRATTASRQLAHTRDGLAR